MQKKTFFFVGALLCLLIGGWLYYMYQKPREGVHGHKADYTIAASALYQAFARQEAEANKKYVDKVVQVEGTVQQIDTLQGSINILLSSNAAEGGVNCALVKTDKKLMVGQPVIVKGRCTGFLMDVSLVDAVIED